jgi:glutamate racemase
VSASAEPRSSDPIAVFDSGVGGLTVLHELLVSLPHEDFVYLGDTARFPYGDRSSAEVARFALELSTLLLERERAKLLVVACNTATSVALNPLKVGSPLPPPSIRVPTRTRSRARTPTSGWSASRARTWRP